MASSSVVLPDVNFTGLLAHHAAVRGDAPALMSGDVSMSYAQFSRRSEQLAAQLWHTMGVRTGDRVAWLGFNHVDQIALLFALARIGAMLVPLNFRLAPAEWRAVLADCTPASVIHDAHWADAARELAATHGIASHTLDSLDSAIDEAAPHTGEPSSPALLVYTSGTTGMPKGAVHTQANLMAGMRIGASVQKMQSGDTVLTVLPLFHVGGLCIQTLPALLAGARVVLHARFDPAATLADIARHRPTLTVQVPATMKALIEHPQWEATDLSCLRAAWAGSSVLPAALVAAFHARGVPVCNVYGATETGPFSIALPPQSAMHKAGSCGWPAPGVEASLHDVQQGVGEVLLRAPNVAATYWPGKPALDAQGWFHTGDLGQRADDGSYTIVGRAKDMIISGGENIYPAEIENLLAAHAAVAECAVIGMPDAQWGEVVVAAVVLREGHEAGDGALLAHLQGRIARYKLPRRFVRLQALPKTALGKIQKPLLAQTLTAAALALP